MYTAWSESCAGQAAPFESGFGLLHEAGLENEFMLGLQVHDCNLKDCDGVLDKYAISQHSTQSANTMR